MEKLGLVLEGGGVKGAYEVGVMSVLGELGIDFDGVAGTSIGAVNGALYLQGGYALMQEVWQGIYAGTILDIDDEILEKLKNRQIDRATLQYFKERVTSKQWILSGSYEKTQKFFSAIADEEALRKSGKDYGLITYNISDKKPVELMMDEIEEGKLIDFIIASATFPVFPPKVIDGKKYLDGGIYDNMPINLLARHGYDKILVLRTNVSDKRPRRELERNDLDLFYVCPENDLGHAMAFTSKRVENLRLLGREDAKRALDRGLREFLM